MQVVGKFKILSIISCSCLFFCTKTIHDSSMLSSRRDADNICATHDPTDEDVDRKFLSASCTIKVPYSNIPPPCNAAILWPNHIVYYVNPNLNSDNSLDSNPSDNQPNSNFISFIPIANSYSRSGSTITSINEQKNDKVNRFKCVLREGQELCELTKENSFDNLCNFKSAYKISLRAHLLSKYHNNKKTLLCNFCSKRYFSESAMSVHIKMHTNNKCTKGTDKYKINPMLEPFLKQAIKMGSSANSLNLRKI